MGSAASVPAAKEGDINLDVGYPGTVDPNLPSLSSEEPLTAVSSSKKVEIILAEKIFLREDQEMVPIEQATIGSDKKSSFYGLQLSLHPNDKPALVDTNNKVLALCLRAFGADTIYTLAPSFTDQAPFAYQKYKGESLYVYAVVERKRQRIEVRLGRDAEEKTKSKSLPTFTNRSTPQQRWIQNRNGNVVATVDRMMERIDEGTGHHNFVAYTNSRLTISPGLDPCLVLFVAAMVDEMDARRRQARMDMCANLFATY